MLNKIYKINMMIIYLIVGIITIIFRNDLLEYLHLLVGISMLVLGLQALFLDIYFKTYQKENNKIGLDLVRVVLSIIIITAFHDDLILVCVCWAIIAILSSCVVLSRSIHSMFKKEFFIFEMLFSIAEITFAIILISDPFEHVTFHIVILGVEFILESISILIDLLYTKVGLKNKKREIK